MRTIIIPTDFSPLAATAMHYAVALARPVDASVLLLNVYGVPVNISEDPALLIPLDDVKKIAEDGLDRLKKEVEAISGGKIKIYAEARLGDVTDELENACAETKPFAVVMGTKGASALEIALFGSTTLKAIHHLTWPVICVPPDKKFEDGIKKIGFACDFKNVVETTPAGFIKDFVSEFHAELHVLNVDYPDHQKEPAIHEQSLLLDTMLAEAKPQYHFIENKDIEEGISE